MGSLNPREVSYRPAEYRSNPATGYQGLPGKPSNDPLRAKKPWHRKPKVGAAELQTRRQARAAKEYARLSRQAAALGRTVAAPSMGALAGIAGRAFGRFLPVIGVGLTLWDLYEFYRSYQGRDAFWSMPTGWTETLRCSPTLAGSALRDVSRATWVHQCYIGQAVANTYNTTHRHRILWGQSNGLGTLWSVISSWQWPGALPNNNGVATYNPAHVPQWDPVDLPVINPAFDPMVLPINKPVPTPQPVPWSMLPYMTRNPYRVEQSERHNEVPKGRVEPAKPTQPVPQPAPAPAPSAPPASSPGSTPARPPAGRLEPRIQRTRMTRTRPRRRTKERKVKDKLGLIRRVLSQTTEVFDLVDALHKSLPKNCKARPVWAPEAVRPGANPYGRSDAQRDRQATIKDQYGYGFTPRGVAIPLDRANENLYRKPTPYEKARAVYKCMDKVDIETALYEWAKSQLVDKIVGKANRKAQRETRRFNPNRPISWIGGPAL